MCRAPTGRARPTQTAVQGYVSASPAPKLLIFQHACRPALPVSAWLGWFCCSRGILVKQQSSQGKRAKRADADDEYDLDDDFIDDDDVEGDVVENSETEREGQFYVFQACSACLRCCCRAAETAKQAPA